MRAPCARLALLPWVVFAFVVRHSDLFRHSDFVIRDCISIALWLRPKAAFRWIRGIATRPRLPGNLHEQIVAVVLRSFATLVLAVPADAVQPISLFGPAVPLRERIEGMFSDLFHPQ